jgi:hypothetical protein
MLAALALMCSGNIHNLVSGPECVDCHSFRSVAKDGSNPVAGGISDLKVKTYCVLGEQHILCGVPYEKNLQMHHISTKIEGSVSPELDSLCSKTRKQKKYQIAVAKKGKKCSAAVQAKNAAAAGYKALIIIGGRNYDQKQESDKLRTTRYKIPVAAIDDMGWKMAKVRAGTHTSLHFKVGSDLTLVCPMLTLLPLD